MKKFTKILISCSIIFTFSTISSSVKANTDENTSNLYHEDSSYCSKYVYLFYLWDANPKALIKYKLNTHIVTPHGLIGNFINSYGPKCIHKIIGY